GGNSEPQCYAIPGIYKTNSPGILFNLYSSYDSYPIPGPPLYVAGAVASAGGSSSSSEATDASSSSEAAVSEPASSEQGQDITSTAAAVTPEPSATGQEQESNAPTSSAPSSIPTATAAPGKCH
ncbi:hypothetical protein GGI22_004407, partial [Coemansia erecta]